MSEERRRIRCLQEKDVIFCYYSLARTLGFALRRRGTNAHLAESIQHRQKYIYLSINSTTFNRSQAKGILKNRNCKRRHKKMPKRGERKQRTKRRTHPPQANPRIRSSTATMHQERRHFEIPRDHHRPTAAPIKGEDEEQVGETGEASKDFRDLLPLFCFGFGEIPEQMWFISSGRGESEPWPPLPALLQAQ